MEKINSYIALGDSFTEGVGDFDDRYPNGVRGWADRVAQQLAHNNPDFTYANLAIRGYLLDQIIDNEVEPALEMRPDMITFCAGGNNLIRPKTNLDELISKTTAILDKFLEQNIKVVVWTAADAPNRPIFRQLRGRFALFNELLREVLAERPEIMLVDYWRMHEYENSNLWDDDRLHMSALGHKIMAKAVLEVLQQANDLEDVVIPPEPELTAAEVRKDDIRWYREFLVPWISRRIKGTSSGDNIKPKYPKLAPVSFPDDK